MKKIDDMNPREMVEALDTFIVGQKKAKRAVSIALRNRVRRRKLPSELQDEVYPKNIIMIGSTGVGKTEIARRLSKITGAPFVKVEATKYTEVGYVGRDVESMIRDLMSVSIRLVREEMHLQVHEEVEKRSEEALIDLLIPTGAVQNEQTTSSVDQSREFIRNKLHKKELEDNMVEMTVPKKAFPTFEIFSGNSMEEMDLKVGDLGSMFGGQKKKKKMTVKRAREYILQEEKERLVDQDHVVELAKERVENMGIVFIDEIDKITARGSRREGGDVSREGVQRDILPIVEGSQVNTRHGIVNTTHILFIAAGSFHSSKPSDLIPELQGRFPIRVEMEDLNADDYYRILIQPKNALILQYRELLKVEGIELVFEDDAVHLLSEIAVEVNTKTENIGARRLHSILELLLEELSFTANELEGQKITITVPYVKEKLSSVVQDEDLSHFVL